MLTHDCVLTPGALPQPHRHDVMPLGYLRRDVERNCESAIPSREVVVTDIEIEEILSVAFTHSTWLCDQWRWISARPAYFRTRRHGHWIFAVERWNGVERNRESALPSCEVVVTDIEIEEILSVACNQIGVALRPVVVDLSAAGVFPFSKRPRKIYSLEKG